MVNAVEVMLDSPEKSRVVAPQVVLSQAAIGRALGLSPAAITKLKAKGMPVDSVESAQAWRVARQNVAQRKPLPVAAVTPTVGAPGGDVDRSAMAGFFPESLPSPDMSPWPGAGRGMSDAGDDGRNLGDGGGDESFERARIRHKVAEANLAELEEARIKGLHVEKSKVDMAFFEASRGLRDGMTNCSRRLAAEVATLTTPSECEVVIARELRHLLESFTRQLVQKASVPVIEDAQP